MIVCDVHVREVYRCPRVLEINIYAFIGNADRPEQPAWSDAGVEVVDLIGRSNLPLIEIQSYEAERAEVLFPIEPDVHTLHETHIDIEEEGAGATGVGLRSNAGTLDFCGRNETVEIGDRGFFDARPDRKDVEQLCSGTKGLDAAGDGPRSVVACRERQPRHPES